MNQMMQNLRCLLEQGEHLDLDSYIRILYTACEKHRYCNETDIARVREELEAYVEGLEFRKQDRILSTVNALCACFEYAGFSEGFRRGSELILELQRAE